jgi:hypothetical protein
MKKYIWLLVFFVYIFLVYLVIRYTPVPAALQNDAQAFVDLAKSPFQSKHFIDLGYPVALHYLSLLAGQNNVIAMQILNYFFWVCGTYFIYLSLRSMKSLLTLPVTLLMLFSPLFLTFSAKLYSEPLSALGVAILVYGLSVGITWTLVLGVIIVVTTKSIFFPGIILLGLYLLFNNLRRRGLAILITSILLIPYFLGSLGGGRTLYNLAIERAKLDLRYDQILACAPYYLSYPAGQYLLPQYEGVCRQNDVIDSLPGAQQNPYKTASAYRDQGFTYLDWVKSVVSQPLKYLLIFLVGLFNLALFEGVYPSILLQLPILVVGLCYLVFKLFLNLYLWSRIYQVSKKTPILFIPFIYLFIVIGNFQVEPRYIYPLIPYVYFLVGISKNILSSARKDNNHQ